MPCKNRITLIGFLGQDAESRATPNGNAYTRFSLATSLSWKENGSNEYKTRTEMASHPLLEQVGGMGR
jgi:single-strand DNA-binding protein